VAVAPTTLTAGRPVSPSRHAAVPALQSHDDQ
jgi:hypothetical protein